MKINFDDLTLGVELEGAFSSDLVNLVDERGLGRFRGDGSVELDRLVRRMHKPFASHAEFNTHVVNWEMLQQILELFKAPDYYTDESCGLHLHVGCKKLTPEKMSFLIADLHFLKGIKTMAVNRFGQAQVDRLNRKLSADRYYGDYRDVEDLDYGIETGSKYQFVRFHPNYHTLEFRFLYPYCDLPARNIDNIKLLLSALCERLNSKQVWEYPVEIVQEIKRGYCKKINIDVPILRVGDTEHEFNLVI